MLSINCDKLSLARGEARIHSIPRRAASACVALDGLGQVSALGFGQRVFLRPRQEMDRDIAGQAGR